MAAVRFFQIFSKGRARLFLSLNHLLAAFVSSNGAIFKDQPHSNNTPRSAKQIWVHKYIYLENVSFKNKLIIFVIGVFLIVSLDLMTKAWAEKNFVREVTDAYKTPLAAGEYLVSFVNDERIYAIKEVAVIDHFWSFTYTRNYNIGFSLLSFLERYFAREKISYAFIFLQGMAVCLLIGYFVLTRMGRYVPFVLIIGGGIANVLDRSYRGYVVDFVKWYWEGSPIAILNPWPLFNVADVGISLGICLFILSLLVE
ncbi:lipoprotein signal peptidase [Spirochaetota bacterium]|nr:lipoprotein signal peptidase [Spirochaetota bacterium]